MSAQAAERMACLSRSPALRRFSLPSAFLHKPSHHTFFRRCSSKAYYLIRPHSFDNAQRHGFQWIALPSSHALKKGSSSSSPSSNIGFQKRRFCVASPQAVVSAPPSKGMLSN